ncbi:hypothetical protein M885DRAFT_501222 [Pelagophyceae sp. CCMP2097]|nr:hypothetical protein M885DRAFT_501222 [Pelagophyceae sp. CCMP2097]
MRCSAWMMLMGGAALVTAGPATDEGGDGMAMMVARKLLQLAPPSVFRTPRASVQMAEMGIGDGRGGRGGRAGIGGDDGGLAFYDRVGIDDDDGPRIDDGGGLSIDSDDLVAHWQICAQNAYYNSLELRLRSSNTSFVDHDVRQRPLNAEVARLVSHQSQASFSRPLADEEGKLQNPDGDVRFPSVIFRRVRLAACGASRAGWITVSCGKNRSKYKGICAATTNVNLASDVNMTSK